MRPLARAECERLRRIRTCLPRQFPAGGREHTGVLGHRRRRVDRQGHHRRRRRRDPRQCFRTVGATTQQPCRNRRRDGDDDGVEWLPVDLPPASGRIQPRHLCAQVEPGTGRLDERVDELAVAPRNAPKTGVVGAPGARSSAAIAAVRAGCALIEEGRQRGVAADTGVGRQCRVHAADHRINAAGHDRGAESVGDQLAQRAVPTGRPHQRARRFDRHPGDIGVVGQTMHRLR